MFSIQLNKKKAIEMQSIKSNYLINVSNRLPVQYNGGIKKSAGGLVSAFEDIVDELQFQWFGWAGTYVKTKAEKETIEKQLNSFDFKPVFLDKIQIDAYYDGFCNSSLWPLFHYFPTYYNYKHEWFVQYQTVNQLFCDALAKEAPKESSVWIHDYHLLLLPHLLKEKRPDLKIAFFLHTPFPSYEIFRIHPNRTTLLKGILGADLIGFHTYNYLRHFKSAVLRILDIESDLFQVKNYPTQSNLGVYPIGISWNKMKHILYSKPCKTSKTGLIKTYKDKKLILGVERMDYTKGIPEKLDAIEHFLENNPKWHHKVQFVQIAVPSRLNVEANKSLVKQIETRVSQINGKFGTMNLIPINFIYHSVSQEDLFALYDRADICMVTPLIDGMNLVAKEYVACKEGRAGVLILSEFAGAAQELHHAMIVNPYNSFEMSQSILEALQMPTEKAKSSMEKMRYIVQEKNATKWSSNVLKDLTNVKLKYLIDENNTQINDSDFLLKSFRHCKKSMLFFDYDGSLREIEKTPEKAVPTNEIYEVLNTLIKHPSCFELCIISGRKSSDLETWFGHLPIHLVSEHGFFIKRIGKDWDEYEKHISLDWLQTFKSVIEDFCISTPGSRLEEKRSSLVWHYRACDPDFGAFKAEQLFSELHAMATNFPVNIHKGQKKTVEVSSQEINKGLAMMDLIAKKNPDMIICFGDDFTDESMFELNLNQFYPVKIGLGNTAAPYRLESPKALRKLLFEMAKT